MKQKLNLKNKIIAVLKQIPDSELGISLWDLGLIYKIEIKGQKVEILMTLTSLGCPLFGQIESLVKKEVGSLPFVAEVVVHLTFDPPWTIAKMSKKAKIELGFI